MNQRNIRFIREDYITVGTIIRERLIAAAIITLKYINRAKFYEKIFATLFILRNFA